MNKTKSKRLGIVLDLARRDENMATEQLQKSQAVLIQEKHKLADLEAYYQEYVEIFQQQRKAVLASQLGRERLFLQKLSDAQDQQKLQIDAAEKLAQHRMALWRTCHLKRKSLDELIERLRRDETRVLERKEQKLLDEWFARASDSVRKGSV